MNYVDLIAIVKLSKREKQGIIFGVIHRILDISLEATVRPIFPHSKLRAYLQKFLKLKFVSRLHMHYVQDFSSVSLAVGILQASKVTSIIEVPYASTRNTTYDFFKISHKGSKILM